MTTLNSLSEMTKQELINDAFAFSKYGNDVEAMEYLNDVLSELRWSMTSVEFSEFSYKINKLVKESDEL